ncbi:IclR family transcriptional regulator [Ferviditalea candida]|uniref:IclR family transcriptional regulator n=1 Tax=Ferviditalea candida TaxID=3108399 RepID=A0ABU5ZED7_9BACL|nr:IclR family transcriptional regulator [Paenibacillaceae bacterium T2]
MEKAKKGATIQSLQIGFSIVDLVAGQGRPLKFNDIYELTGITKSNLYKYINTLTQQGILYRDRETGAYTLGSKLVEYGMAAVNRENVSERILPFMQEINRTCKSTVLLISWTHDGPIVVRMINNNQGLNIGAQIGTYLPLLSASGKIFAAFLEESLVRDWKLRELGKLKEERRKALERELDVIRDKQISFADEPLVPTISSVSIPIFNFGKQLLGAVTVVGFSETVPQTEQDELSRYLLQMQREISRVFGYRNQTAE